MLVKLIQYFEAKMRRLTEGTVTKFYASRHPGTVAAALIAACVPLRFWFSPNDKWSLPLHAPGWFDLLQSKPKAPLPKPRRIFLFTAYRGQFSLNLAFAILLAWRGHRITFGYLPKLQSPIKWPILDHPSARPYLVSTFERLGRRTGDRIKFVDLSAFADDAAPIDEELNRTQSFADMIMYERRETISLDDPATAGMWNFYRELGTYSQKVAHGYFRRHAADHDLAIIPNGTTFESAYFCAVARNFGLPVNTMEKFAFKRVRIVNHGENFRSFADLDLAWRHRAKLGFLDDPFRSQAVARARALVDERRTASVRSWAWTHQISPDQTASQALAQAKIPAGATFALVCTNVPYDAGYDGLLGLFGSMREWLIETVRHLLDNTSIHVVVRAHPGEAAHYGGRERSEEILAEFLGNPRLSMLPGDHPVNTYALMEACAFGVVFSSTVGLELVMSGKPAIVGARVYYADRGFTVDSAERSDYFAHLDRYAADGGPRHATPDQSEDAALFHFILHFVMQWPYPHDKAGELRLMSTREQMESPEGDKFLPVLDALCELPAEWPDRMIDYLHARTGRRDYSEVLRQ